MNTLNPNRQDFASSNDLRQGMPKIFRYIAFRVWQGVRKGV